MLAMQIHKLHNRLTPKGGGDMRLTTTEAATVIRREAIEEIARSTTIEPHMVESLLAYGDRATVNTFEALVTVAIEVALDSVTDGSLTLVTE
jgi:ABC-type uncharacterized transport system permease subunit